MKIFSLLAVSTLLLFSIGGSKPNYRQLDAQVLQGRISITLDNGIWKLWNDQPVYQDITLDLNCAAQDNQPQCESEIWAYAPKFNKEVDHQGTVKVIQTDNAWQLQVKLKIQSHPWDAELQEANYQIEIIPDHSKLIGSYRGKYQDRWLLGKVEGKFNNLAIHQLSHHQEIQPQEHPRLLFRASQVPLLKAKAQTNYGKAIIKRLKTVLQEEAIYYDAYVPNAGYHAASYCFLSLLENDAQAAETAWKLVQKSIQNPGKRLLEHSPIVAGVAIAYDLCYQAWGEQRNSEITRWLANQTVKLVQGDSPKKGWNGNAWSNWNARARGAAGLAALAIWQEPVEFFPDNKFLIEPDPIWRLIQISQRNLIRYLDLAIGDRGFGTEGDHYTTEPLFLTVMPWLQAYKNVIGREIAAAKTQWFLPHHIMRQVKINNKLTAPTYGRHRSSPGSFFFATGLPLVTQQFQSGVFWYFDRYFGIKGDRTFGIDKHFPHTAIFALLAYRDDVRVKNPNQIWGRTLIDKQKGFYVFRNHWQDTNDFIASIYLKQQPLSGSWSFPDTGSFRIWGLGQQWAIAGRSESKPEFENIILNRKNSRQAAKPLVEKVYPDGSGVVSLVQDNWLRSFAVDYSGTSGTPGLFALVDRFETRDIDDFQRKTWVMHVKGKVKLDKQRFTITSQSGATMQGVFVSPDEVQLSYKPTKTGGVIHAQGINNFFVVMTVQRDKLPRVKIEGSGLAAKITIGKQTVQFDSKQLLITTD